MCCRRARAQRRSPRDRLGRQNNIRVDIDLLDELLRAAAALTVSLFLLESERGKDLAEEVKNGTSVVPERYELLSVFAYYTCIDWTGDDRPAELSEEAEFMRLGQGDMLVLYDFDNDVPLRLPIGKVALIPVQTERPEPAPCAEARANSSFDSPRRRLADGNPARHKGLNSGRRGFGKIVPPSFVAVASICRRSCQACWGPEGLL